MKTNNPKRQHYYPVMLLKNFSNERGRIWVGDGTNVYVSKPEDVFVQGHLYTKLDFSNAQGNVDCGAFIESVPKSYEFEERLGEIEDAAAPAIRQIIELARLGDPPRLTTEMLDACKHFIIAMARRTPESQARLASSLDVDAFYEAAKLAADQDNFPLPDKESLYRNPDMVQLKYGMMKNTNARFAAGAHPLLEIDTQDFLEETGLCIAVIRIPGRSFIAGSHGLTIIDDSIKGKFLPALSWLPVAPDIAIGITNQPSKLPLFVLDGLLAHDPLIAAINLSTTTGSSRIAGSSEKLVRSLMHAQLTH